MDILPHDDRASVFRREPCSAPAGRLGAREQVDLLPAPTDVPVRYFDGRLNFLGERAAKTFDGHWLEVDVSGALPERDEGRVQDLLGHVS